MREDNEMRELFSEMREEAVPAESLARVRRAVGVAVAARRRSLGWWKVAVLLAAVGCLAEVMVKVRTEAPVVQAPVVAAEAPAVEQGAPVVVRSVGTSADAAGKSARATSKPVKHVDATPIENGASEIRIESDDDPDVVILLIGG